MSNVDREGGAGSCRERRRNPDEFAIAKGGEKVCVWQDYELSARTAIEAMREPTVEMIAAASSLVEGGSAVQYTQNTYAVWRLMIDAALK